MQPLESFTAIADVLGRNRQVTFNELDGLTIANLSGREATVLVGAIEKLDGQLLAHLLAGRPLIVDESADGAPQTPSNQAQWTPAAPRPAPDADQTAPDAPTGGSQPPPRAGPPAQKPAQEPAQEPEERAPAAVPNTGVQCAPDLAPIPPPVLPVDKPPTLAAVGTLSEATEAVVAPRTPRARPATTPTAAEVLGKTPSATKTARAKPNAKPKAKKAPPRVGELLPDIGDDYDGHKIKKFQQHSDGGRLLVLENGVRVKLSKKGKEVARTEAPPEDLDLGDTKTGEEFKRDTEAAAEAAPATPPKDFDVPKNVMDTRMTKEVIEFLLEQGVQGHDALAIECIKLKEQGAKAFAASKDDDAVRRRVRSTLTVLWGSLDGPQA